MYIDNVVVIYTNLSADEGVSNLPALLRGEGPPSASADIIGTGNYSSPAKAVVTGGGYEEIEISDMRRACNGSKVPWLRNDKSKPAPPPGPAYAAAVVERVKALLKDLAAEEKMQVDGVYWY